MPNVTNVSVYSAKIQHRKHKKLHRKHNDDVLMLMLQTAAPRREKYTGGERRLICLKNCRA